MRLKRVDIFRAILCFCCLNTICGAQDQRETQFSIDLTKRGESEARATWGKPLDITPKGLGWEGDPASERAGWIQTFPIPLGASWCPTRQVTVVLGIQPQPRVVALANGQEFTPFAGNVFIRYTPDLKHWSTWQSLQPIHKSAKELGRPAGSYFGGNFSIPQRQTEQYSNLVQKYAALDIPWKSDQEAAVRWILKMDPKFWSKNLPFMGYVQFLYESSFNGSRRIRKITGEVAYELDGFYQPPTDGTDFEQRDRLPWRYSGHSDVRVYPVK